MDLTMPVMLKNIPMDFEEYSRKIRQEQESSLRWMTVPGAQWHVPGSLRAKVNPEGALLPFYGDTVTIPLSPEDIEVMKEYQQLLYKHNGEILAEFLLPQHFHITLHDLSNAPSLELINDKIEKNKEMCKRIFERISHYFKKNPDLRRVSLSSVYTYPSVNISVVLGFCPQADRDYRIIMNLYNLFDEVVYLDYWLRLHLTLSYFKPIELSETQMNSLHTNLIELSRKKTTIHLDLNKLSYQRFTNMNDYKTIFCVEDF